MNTYLPPRAFSALLAVIFTSLLTLASSASPLSESPVASHQVEQRA